MKFKYKAIKKDGVRYEGTRESFDKNSLYSELKKDGDTLIYAIPEKTNSFFKKSFSFLSGKVPTHQKIIFARNLGSMIQAGLSLSRALSVMEKQVENRKMKSVITSILSDIGRGLSLSDSIKTYPDIFSGLFVSMVKSGEESGKLSNSLIIISNQMEGIYKLRNKIIGAMIYPLVILIAMIIVGFLMMIYVVPGITATFKDINVSLPFATKVVVFISDMLSNNLILFVGTIILIVFVFYIFSISKFGKRMIDNLVLKIPVIGELIKETNSARISRTLSSLLSSGVPFSDAISVSEEVVQNSNFKEILRDAKIKVEKGETISSVFLSKTKICPVFVGEMMSVGEETGQMPSMLLEVAVFYENSVEQKTKDMSTIVEPVLMIIIGAAVGFFAFSMIVPIYSLMDTI